MSCCSLQTILLITLLGLSPEIHFLHSTSYLYMLIVFRLADLASFHLYASKKYNLTSGNTWVCFGGSYPGALSAWFRLKVSVTGNCVRPKKKFFCFL